MSSTTKKTILVALILVYAICFCFPVIHVFGHGAILFGNDAGPLFDYKVSLSGLLSGEQHSDDFYSGIFFVFSVVPPILFMILALVLKLPMKFISKLFFILFGIANIFLPFGTAFVLVFNIFGPDKFLTWSSVIVLLLHFISGILFLLIGIKENIGNFFQKGNAG